MINSLYSIGLSSLQNALVAVNNASNNIANADTEGYQRTTTVTETRSGITSGDVELGTGANVVLQSTLNKFVEKQYIAALSDLQRYNAEYEYASQLDSLFSQSEDSGLGVTLDSFWQSWQDLADDPDSDAARTALLGYADQLVSEIDNTMSELETMQQTLESELDTQVDEANDLIETIAELNKALLADPDNNGLISQQTQAVRDLGEYLSVTTVAQDNGQTNVYTTEGLPLVTGSETHALSYEPARATSSLTSGSSYDGQINFSGESDTEILLEFVSSGADGTAQFKVSLDGGKTWETDDTGATKLYTADTYDNSVEIEGLDIWFSGAITDHTAGDRYTIVPKSNINWVDSSGGSVNITPLETSDGSQATNRISSGSLAGLMTVRDQEILDLQSDLDALAHTLIKEVNLLHSQGAGQEPHSLLTGTYAMDDTTVPLDQTGLEFEDALSSGTFSLSLLDSDGTSVSNVSLTIDPSSDSLADIVADINASSGGLLTASVTADNTLQLTAASGYSFEVSEDDAGLMTALGLNTFFKGTDASTLDVNKYVSSDQSHINAGSVGSNGTVNSGSNDIAKALAELGDTSVDFTSQESQTTITEYVAGLVSQAGSASSTAETNVTYFSASAEYYSDQQASASGVNVDEETVNLTLYQQQYKAASRILQTMQEMFETILEIT